jgi:hypothetical protein
MKTDHRLILQTVSDERGPGRSRFVSSDTMSVESNSYLQALC